MRRWLVTALTLTAVLVGTLAAPREAGLQPGPQVQPPPDPIVQRVIADTSSRQGIPAERMEVRWKRQVYPLSGQELRLVKIFDRETGEHLMRAEVHRRFPELARYIQPKCGERRWGYCDESYEDWQKCPIGQKRPHKRDLFQLFDSYRKGELAPLDEGDFQIIELEQVPSRG